MRKRGNVWAACGAALLAVALAGAMPGRASAQSDGTPWLGVTTQDITDELREGLDYRGNGVLVNRVVADSPADRAGIRKGDVIVSFNSRSIDTPSELVDVVRSARVGQSIAVTVVRDGSRRSLNARLAEWPDAIDEESDTPTPEAAPRAPRVPRAPEPPAAPRAYRFDLNGGGSDWSGYDLMLRSMGRGRLGVQIQDLSDGLGEALGVPDGKGVLVSKVVADTPAAKAGMKAGDVIIRVGDTDVEDTGDLQRALRDREGRVSITVMRKGVRRTIDAELDSKRNVERDVIRMRRGDTPTVLRIPDIRTRVMRDLSDNDSQRGDLEQQLRELRQELRELRKKLEAMDKN